MRDGRRKEGRSKQDQTKKEQLRQSNTAHERKSLFLRKMSCLRWDSNPRHSTMYMYMYMYMYLLVSIRRKMTTM